MKRYIGIVLVVVLLLGSVGCSKTKDNPTQTTTATTAAGTTTVTTVTADGTQSDVTVTADGQTTTAMTPPTTASTKAPATPCAHEHVQEATCLTAAKCLDCNETIGEALGHNYVGKSCTRCGKKNPNYTARVEVIGVKLDRTGADMLVGETLTLNHTISPDNATDNEVTWKSSNPSIATVTADGTVKAVAVGEATITASSLNGKTATCKIKVQDIVVEMPRFPMELIYNAQHNKVAIFIMMEGVDYTYTQTSADAGTLLLLFDGWLSYAGDGHGGYTYPNFGWRLYDSNETVVAEGIAQSKESLNIGSSIAGLTVEIPSVSTGKYRVELYSTYKSKK